MSYFSDLSQALQEEKTADQALFAEQIAQLSLNIKRSNGLVWYPIAIKETEYNALEYVSIIVERTTHQDIPHQFRFGMPVTFFSNHQFETAQLNGTIAYLHNNQMKVSFKVSDLPEWADDGKLGIQMHFDDLSYDEMFHALKQASTLEDKEKNHLLQVIIGKKSPHEIIFATDHYSNTKLNASQLEAVKAIRNTEDIAIIHGPPGTGKTTTLVNAIMSLTQQSSQKILVTAASNTAVDLLCEKLDEIGVKVVRIGNPVRVSEHLQSLTLDYQYQNHDSAKQIKLLKKQAQNYRAMATKYKRSFGKEEREQRRLLLQEAKKVMQDVQNIEQYIAQNVLENAQVVAATLVGTHHKSVQHLNYQYAFIDEAAQALEPACWIPILKAEKVILAGDHQQLPPVVKATSFSKDDLTHTLFEKLIARYPHQSFLLDTQYRMHESIMQFSSGHFYENKLIAAPEVARTTLHGQLPLNFIDTAGTGFEEVIEGTSISNPEEAQFVLQHVQRFMEELQERSLAIPEVIIIAPYRKQIQVLKTLMSEHETLKPFQKYIKINTIDSFQGQESPVVYISMTRSNNDQKIGFLSELRRMNVAMTRAQQKLVVIGDSTTLSQHPFYDQYIQFTSAKEGYSSAWEWM